VRPRMVYSGTHGLVRRAIISCQLSGLVNGAPVAYNFETEAASGSGLGQLAPGMAWYVDDGPPGPMSLRVPDADSVVVP